MILYPLRACHCRHAASLGLGLRARQENSWLKPLLVQCAWAAVRKKDSDLKRQFASIAPRRGPKKAIMAVAGSMLSAIYHMIRDGVPDAPPAPRVLDAPTKSLKAKRLAKQIRALGFAVEGRQAA